MRKKFMTTRLGITIVVSVSAHTYAGEPMSVDFGGMSLTPALKITEAYDDNIRETSVNEISSWVTTIEQVLRCWLRIETIIIS